MTTTDQQPVTLYDTTLRDGTQGENITLSLADKLRVAQMLDEYGFPFIEGGWPGSNPKDIEFFAAARKIRWQQARLAAFGSTRHKANRPGDDPNLRELVAAETPVVTIFGKSWLLHVVEVLGATPAENLDMIADSVGFVVDHGREAVYDAEHFFDGYRADRDYALATLRAARQAGSRTLVLCDTNGGTLTNDLVEIVGDVRAIARGGPGRARGDLGHPHPQRRRARGRELDRRGPGRRPPRAGDHQRLRRAVRQREHGLDPREPRAQDVQHALPVGWRRPRRPDPAQPRGRGDREPGPQRLPAVRRPVGVRAQGRRPRRGRGQGRAQLPARGPGRRRQRRAASWCPSSAARPTPRSAPASWATSSRASSTRASCRRSSSASRTRAWPSRAPRRRSSC